MSRSPGSARTGSKKTGAAPRRGRAPTPPPRAPRAHRPQPRFAVIAYGKLGGKELGYGGDLDVVFVFDDEDENASEIYGAFVRRLITWLTLRTAAGELFDIDTALRPNGGSGMLVTSIASFEKYQTGRGSNTAWTWEHQAMTRARFVMGWPGLAPGGWVLIDIFPGMTFNLRTSVLRMDTAIPLGPNKLLIEFRGLGLKSDTPDERAERADARGFRDDRAENHPPPRAERAHAVELRLRRRLDQADRTVRQLAHGADHLRMALVADQDDLEAFRVMALRFHVHLGDQRAGGVELEHVARPSGGGHRLRHAMGGKHHRPVAIGDLVELVDEDGALGLQVIDHELVVHDFVIDVNRCAV